MSFLFAFSTVYGIQVWVTNILGNLNKKFVDSASTFTLSKTHNNVSGNYAKQHKILILKITVLDISLDLFCIKIDKLFCFQYKKEMYLISPNCQINVKRSR